MNDFGNNIQAAKQVLWLDAFGIELMNIGVYRPFGSKSALFQLESIHEYLTKKLLRQLGDLLCQLIPISFGPNPSQSDVWMKLIIIRPHSQPTEL